MKSVTWYVLLSWVLLGCVDYESSMLDRSIPRVETPSEQIATVRFKTFNGRLLQTVLFVHRGGYWRDMTLAGRTAGFVIGMIDSLK